MLQLRMLYGAVQSHMRKQIASASATSERKEQAKAAKTKKAGKKGIQ